MTNTDFTELLDEEGYSYVVKGGVAAGVTFENDDGVSIKSATRIAAGVTFENGGKVTFMG